MNKTKKIINKNMLIGEIIEKWPELGEVLTGEYGFHCIGCMASGMETLEEGAMVHGLGDEDIKVLIENLNELVAEKDKI